LSILCLLDVHLSPYRTFTRFSKRLSVDWQDSGGGISISSCSSSSNSSSSREQWEIVTDSHCYTAVQYKVALEVVSCHRRTVRRRTVSELRVLLIEVSCSCWNTCQQ
jgi:hypothetical protein